MEEGPVGSADTEGDDELFRFGAEGEFAIGLVVIEEIDSFLIDGDGGGLEGGGLPGAGLLPVEPESAFGGLEIESDAGERILLHRGRDGPEGCGEEEAERGGENGPPVVDLFLFGRRGSFWSGVCFGAEREGGWRWAVTGPDERGGAGDGNGGDGDVEAGGGGGLRQAAMDGPLADGLRLNSLGKADDFRAIWAIFAKQGAGAGVAFAGFGGEDLEGQLAELGLDLRGERGNGESGSQRDVPSRGDEHVGGQTGRSGSANEFNFFLTLICI